MDIQTIHWTFIILTWGASWDIKQGLKEEVYELIFFNINVEVSNIWMSTSPQRDWRTPAKSYAELLWEIEPKLCLHIIILPSYTSVTLEVIKVVQIRTLDTLIGPVSARGPPQLCDCVNSNCGLLQAQSFHTLPVDGFLKASEILDHNLIYTFTTHRSGLRLSTSLDTSSHSSFRHCGMSKKKNPNC